MTDRPNIDSNLTFVVTTNPSEANSQANKKRVRSVAAQSSWPERRRRTFEERELSTTTNRRRRSAADERLRQGHPIDVEPQPPTSQPAGEVSGQNSPSVSALRLAGAGDQAQEALPLFEKCTGAVNAACACSHCRFERTFSTGTSRSRETSPYVTLASGRKRTADGRLKLVEVDGELTMFVTPLTIPPPSPLSLLNRLGKGEPFGCYPLPYLPWFDRVVHHLTNIYEPRSWSEMNITGTEGVRWRWFATQQSLSEPALFYLRLFFASHDLVHLEVLGPQAMSWLQAQAIQTFNEALRDHLRASSTAIILGVGRIALHEALYGDEHAVAVHRTAQRRMIAMRGGIGALNVPELVRRLMRQGDTIMALRTNTERLIEDDEGETEDPDVVMTDNVDVSEGREPRTRRETLRKIKISDLLLSDPSPGFSEPRPSSS